MELTTFKEVRRKVLLFAFSTAVYAFCMGLSLAGAIRHPDDPHYYGAVPFWLILAIVGMLMIRREFGRILSPSTSLSSGN